MKQNNLRKRVVRAKPGADGQGGTPKDEKKRESPSQATLLVRLTNDCPLWHSPDGLGFITTPVNGHLENLPIRSSACKRWLQREYFTNYKAACNAQALQDALGVVEGKALFDGPQHDVHVRVAEHRGCIYIDLCDADWRVVEVGTGGWRVLRTSPVKFRRCKAMLSLPQPQPGGDVVELRGHLGLRDENWPLVVAWTLAALRQSGPFPVLNLAGEQGSGKTTVARKLRLLLDPNTAPVRSEPREPRDLMIAANSGRIIALDNLSHINGWLSDAICRLSTGGGFSTRTLYENDEETIFDAMRPVLVTGIEELPIRGDLMDRSLMVNLPAIPEDKRRPESIIWREFDEAKPRLVGVLLDAVALALRNISTTTISGLPRMADFALWVTAAEPAIGLKSGEFMAVYGSNRAAGNELAIEASPVGKVVLDFMASVGVWSGTASDLLTELGQLADDKTTRLHGWPKSPRALSGCMKRLAPNLRVIGVEVELGRTGKGRYVRLQKAGESGVTRVVSVTAPERQGTLLPDGDAWATQAWPRVTRENPRNAADDDGDDDIPRCSANGQMDDLNAELAALADDEAFA